MIVAANLQREKQAPWLDDRLVAECLKGNEKAWSALLDKYKNLIFSIPIKMEMYDDAADIFQAVCLDLLSDLPRLREPRALPKWLMQTCYRKCLQYQRRAERHVPLDEGQEDSSASSASLPDDMLAQLEREQIVRDAMTELNPRCERLVHMLFFESPPRPYQEIASQLGIATGSIGFIRGRCLWKLRKQLEKKGF